MRFQWLLVLCIACLLMPIACAVSAQDNAIVFEDAYVEAHIRRDLDIFDRPLTAEDMLNVTRFFYVPQEIEIDKAGRYAFTTRQTATLPEVPELHSIADLSHCKNLESIWLHHQPTSDLSPLSHLAAIRDIEIVDCPNIIDLSPLARLPALDTIRLDNIGAADLSPVLSLPSLDRFSYNAHDYGDPTSCYFPDAYNAQPIDISALANSDGLTHFSVGNNTVPISYAPLLHQTQLRSASLVAIDAQSLSQLLMRNPSLTWLELSRMTVTEDILSAIAAHGNLESLSLDKVSITGNLSAALRQNPNLDQLRMRNCNLTDLSILDDMPQAITSLLIRGNPLQDISGLERFPALLHLEISHGAPWFTADDVKRLVPNAEIDYIRTDEAEAMRIDRWIAKGMKIFKGSSLPTSWATLPNGDLLISGLESEPGDMSLSAHMMNYRELTGPQWLATRPLHNFVAAISPDGTERWRYEQPLDENMMALGARSMDNGLVDCYPLSLPTSFRTPGKIQHHPAPHVLLDSHGQPTDALAALQPDMGLGLLLPDVYIHRSIPPMDLPAPYQPVLTCYDLQGNQLWESSPDDLDGYFVQNMVSMQNGYMGIAMDISNLGENLSTQTTALFALDTKGNMAWMHVYPSDVMATSITVTPNNHVLISAEHEHNEMVDGEMMVRSSGFLTCFDDKGNELWMQDYRPQLLSLWPYYLEAHGDSLYTIGRRREADPYTPNGNSMLIHMDAKGQVLGHLYLPPPSPYKVGSQQTILMLDDTLYLAGTLPPLSGEDRWYLLPLSPLLFTEGL